MAHFVSATPFLCGNSMLLFQCLSILVRIYRSACEEKFLYLMRACVLHTWSQWCSEVSSGSTVDILVMVLDLLSLFLVSKFIIEQSNT